MELRPDTVLRVIEATDAFRRPERFAEFLLACEADARGRTGLENNAYPQADILRAALDAATSISTEAIKAQGIEGPEFGAALKAARLEAVSTTLKAVRGR